MAGEGERVGQGGDGLDEQGGGAVADRTDHGPEPDPSGRPGEEAQGVVRLEHVPLARAGAWVGLQQMVVDPDRVEAAVLGRAGQGGEPGREAGSQPPGDELWRLIPGG